MEAMNTYYWAQDKIDDMTTPTKQDREKLACERRLKQMAKRREKDAARQTKRSDSHGEYHCGDPYCGDCPMPAAPKPEE